MRPLGWRQITLASDEQDLTQRVSPYKSNPITIVSRL